MKFSISRDDPDRDERPYLQDFEIVRTGSDHMLLDVLLRLGCLERSLARSLSPLAACRESSRTGWRDGPGRGSGGLLRQSTHRSGQWRRTRAGTDRPFAC
jgi:hypothetical protein